MVIFNIKDYLNLSETVDFAYYLFSLSRGVKNNKSLNFLQDFILNNSNTKSKSIKLKEIILILLKELKDY